MRAATDPIRGCLLGIAILLGGGFMQAACSGGYATNVQQARMTMFPPTPIPYEVCAQTRPSDGYLMQSLGALLQDVKRENLDRQGWEKVFQSAATKAGMHQASPQFAVARGADNTFLLGGSWCIYEPSFMKSYIPPLLYYVNQRGEVSRVADNTAEQDYGILQIGWENGFWVVVRGIVDATGSPLWEFEYIQLVTRGEFGWGVSYESYDPQSLTGLLTVRTTCFDSPTRYQFEDGSERMIVTSEQGQADTNGKSLCKPVRSVYRWQGDSYALVEQHPDK